MLLRCEWIFVSYGCYGFVSLICSYIVSVMVLLRIVWKFRCGLFLVIIFFVDRWVSVFGFFVIGWWYSLQYVCGCLLLLVSLWMGCGCCCLLLINRRFCLLINLMCRWRFFSNFWVEGVRWLFVGRWIFVFLLSVWFVFSYVLVMKFFIGIVS